jgi:hypothetical protein
LLFSFFSSSFFPSHHSLILILSHSNDKVSRQQKGKGGIRDAEESEVKFLQISAIAYHRLALHSETDGDEMRDREKGVKGNEK